MSEALRRLADLFLEARRAVAFTGAGVSTESGIPDFRSPGRLWDRFDPSEFTYKNFMDSVAGRRRYWALGQVTYPVIRAARPNAAHLALAEADLVIREKAGVAMAAVLEAVRARARGQASPLRDAAARGQAVVRRSGS